MPDDSTASLAANSSTHLAATAKSYLDFNGLAQLRGQAAQNDKRAMKEAAQQFEALFIQMMLKSMREAVVKDETNGSQAEDLYEDLMDRELSVQFAKREMFGVANMLGQQIQKVEASASAVGLSTEDALRAHGQGAGNETVQIRQRGLPLRPQMKAYQLESDSAAFSVTRPAPISLKSADLVPIKKDESKND